MTIIAELILDNPREAIARVTMSGMPRSGEEIYYGERVYTVVSVGHVPVQLDVSFRDEPEADEPYVSVRVRRMSD